MSTVFASLTSIIRTWYGVGFMPSRIILSVKSIVSIDEGVLSTIVLRHLGGLTAKAHARGCRRPPWRSARLLANASRPHGGQSARARTRTDRLAVKPPARERAAPVWRSFRPPAVTGSRLGGPFGVSQTRATRLAVKALAREREPAAWRSIRLGANAHGLSGGQSVLARTRTACLAVIPPWRERARPVWRSFRLGANTHGLSGGHPGSCRGDAVSDLLEPQRAWSPSLTVGLC